VAGDVLQRSGYELILDRKSRGEVFSKEELHHFDLLNSKMKLEMIDNTKNSDLKKRVKQELLINEIKSRRGTPL